MFFLCSLQKLNQIELVNVSLILLYQGIFFHLWRIIFIVESSALFFLIHINTKILRISIWHASNCFASQYPACVKLFLGLMASFSVLNSLFTLVNTALLQIIWGLLGYNDIIPFKKHSNNFFWKTRKIEQLLALSRSSWVSPELIVLLMKIIRDWEF